MCVVLCRQFIPGHFVNFVHSVNFNQTVTSSRRPSPRPCVSMHVCVCSGIPSFIPSCSSLVNLLSSFGQINHKIVISSIATHREHSKRKTTRKYVPHSHSHFSFRSHEPNTQNTKDNSNIKPCSTSSSSVSTFSSVVQM